MDLKKKTSMKNTLDKEKPLSNENQCNDCNGACCKRINIKTKEIHKCFYLTEDNLCSIYEDRPIACRLDSRYYDDMFIKMHCKMAKESINNLLDVNEVIKIMVNEF